MLQMTRKRMAHIGRWLALELHWLADAVAGGGAVFGVCFGAQALATQMEVSYAAQGVPFEYLPERYTR